MAVAQSFLCCHSLSIEHFLLHPWQGHLPVQRLGWRHSDVRQGPKGVWYTRGCHSFCTPCSLQFPCCVSYPAFLFNSNSALSYSFIKTAVCGAEVRSISLPALGAIPYTTKILNIFFLLSKRIKIGLSCLLLHSSVSTLFFHTKD